MTSTIPNPAEPRATARALRTGLLALATLALAVGVALPGAAPASAHDQLVSSSPQSGDELAESPAELRLTYSAEILEVGSEVILHDAAGEAVPTPAPTVSGTDVTIELADPLPGGAYTLDWRVVSSDGHPISGAVPFTVAGDPAASDATETATAAPAEPTAPAPTAGSTTAAQPAADAGANALPWILGGGAVLVVFAVIAVLVARRARPATTADDGGRADDRSAHDGTEADDATRD